MLAASGWPKPPMTAPPSRNLSNIPAFRTSCSGLVLGEHDSLLESFFQAVSPYGLELIHRQSDQRMNHQTRTAHLTDHLHRRPFLFSDLSKTIQVLLLQRDDDAGLRFAKETGITTHHLPGFDPCP